jgi:hypothetical protein
MANTLNHCGDSDSTGSITGYILGAVLGVGWLDAELLGELEGRSVSSRKVATSTSLSLMVGTESPWIGIRPGSGIGIRVRGRGDGSSPRGPNRYRQGQCGRKLPSGQCWPAGQIGQFCAERPRQSASELATVGAFWLIVTALTVRV